MNTIKWRCKQLKKWLTYFFLYRGYWKTLWNSESDKSYWEILHNAEDKTVVLHYVPEENYGSKDVKIQVPQEQFEDLVKFIIRIR